MKLFRKLRTKKEQVDIVVLCCVSDTGLVKYVFLSMDPVCLKPNVIVTCAIIDHVRPCLPHTFPKAAVSKFSRIKRVSCCTTKEVLVEREEEMERRGHSWPEPGQTHVSLLTVQALVTLFMDAL